MDETTITESVHPESTPEEAPAQDAPPEGLGAPEPQAPARPEWYRVLDEAPAEELRRHPKVAGLYGSEIEKQRVLSRREIEQAREAAQREAEQQTGDVRTRTRDEFARHVGASVRRLIPPESAEAWLSAMQRLATEGVSDDEVLGRFVEASVEHLVNARVEQYRRTEAELTRQAIRQEVAAEYMRSVPAPDMTRPSRGRGVRGMSDDEFAAHYERLTGRRP